VQTLLGRYHLLLDGRHSAVEDFQGNVNIQELLSDDTVPKYSFSKIPRNGTNYPSQVVIEIRQHIS
jgi:hypothetical protein